MAKCKTLTGSAMTGLSLIYTGHWMLVESQHASMQADPIVS